MRPSLSIPVSRGGRNTSSPNLQRMATPAEAPPPSPCKAAVHCHPQPSRLAACDAALISASVTSLCSWAMMICAREPARWERIPFHEVALTVSKTVTSLCRWRRFLPLVVVVFVSARAPAAAPTTAAAGTLESAASSIPNAAGATPQPRQFPRLGVQQHRQFPTPLPLQYRQLPIPEVHE